MISSRERTHWTGSPDKLAAALNPVVLVGFIVAAAALHPYITAFIGKTFMSVGIDADIARALSIIPGACFAGKTFWIYLTETMKTYTLTDERLIIKHGVLIRVEDEVELYRVIDAVETVNLFQRMIKVGSIIVTSNDHTGTVKMSSIKSSAKVRNGLRKLSERCKTRRGVRVLE